MAEFLFQYAGAGSEPEFLTVAIKEGGVFVVVRQPPHITFDHETGQDYITQGQRSFVTLPLANAIELGYRLLSLPPSEDLAGKVPHVIFFDSETERDAFVKAVLAANPGLARGGEES